MPVNLAPHRMGANPPRNAFTTKSATPRAMCRLRLACVHNDSLAGRWLMDSVRVDRWLCAARIFKSRTQASAACVEGHVQVNGAAVKASHLVRIDDEIHAEAPRGTVMLDVKVLSDKRLSGALARELYHDRSPPPPPRDELFPRRPMGAGRPTKQERRAVRKVRGR